MNFRLVPNSVTLDDLERRNSPNRSVILPNSVAFGGDYVKVVEDTPYFLQRKCRPKNKESSFSDVSLMVTFAGNYPQRERYSKTLPSRQRKFDQ